MKAILEEIKSVPGVIGGFVLDTGQGIALRNLPTVFKDAMLERLGKMVAKIYGSGTTVFADMVEISLHYEESLVIVRRIEGQMYLVILCDPSMNQNLLTMTLNMVMGNLKQAILGQASANHEEPEAPTVSEKVVSHTRQRGFPVEKLLENSPLAETFQKMTSALAKIMGPMAKIIFTDALRQWAMENEPEQESLPALLEILTQEINDPEKTQKYLAAIAPLLGNKES